jgi:hypothetical protein
MATTDTKPRVLIALLESTPVDQLWKAALDRLSRTPSELMAIFFAEDHWHRAASLPFTREISRLSGANVDFTLQRARQIHEASIEEARQVLDRLATDARLPLAFEVLGESERERIRLLASGSEVVLIAPSIIIQRPFYAELEQLDCHIELVDAPETRVGMAAAVLKKN